MIQEVLFSASSIFYGGSIGNLLAKWEQIGVFSYVLPFLVIFALVFGILNQMKLFQSNKAVNSIVALVVGLMALQFDFVPRFFAEVFPRFGIGLAIILIILVITGLFIDPDKPFLQIILLVIGIVIVAVVLISTAGSLGWTTGEWWRENWGTILGILVFLVIVGVIIGSTNKNRKPLLEPYVSYMTREK